MHIRIHGYVEILKHWIELSEICGFERTNF